MISLQLELESRELYILYLEEIFRNVKDTSFILFLFTFCFHLPCYTRLVLADRLRGRQTRQSDTHTHEKKNFTHVLTFAFTWPTSRQPEERRQVLSLPALLRSYPNYTLFILSTCTAEAGQAICHPFLTTFHLFPTFFSTAIYQHVWTMNPAPVLHLALYSLFRQYFCSDISFSLNSPIRNLSSKIEAYS